MTGGADPRPKPPAVAVRFTGVVPILRTFDHAKADEFYLGFLSMAVDWEHRFDPEAPLYRQVSRAGLVLHLSEHHGDGCPGGRLRVAVSDVAALHRELAAKRYRFMRQGLEHTAWRTVETEVIDPFGTVIRFWEPVADAA